MSLVLSIRLIEIFIGFAVMLQSFEHLSLASDKGFLIRSAVPLPYLFWIRCLFSVVLIFGWAPGVSAAFLFFSGLLLVFQYQGPYNGGSDRMALLILGTLSALAIPTLSQFWQEAFLSYLALQLILSYFRAGLIKLKNPKWWTGEVLRGLILKSHYGIEQSSAGSSLKSRFGAAIIGPRAVVISWTLILFECSFPLSLARPELLFLFLAVGAVFHLGNSVVLGLNRFLWVWLSAYPALIWFKFRFF